MSQQSRSKRSRSVSIERGIRKIRLDSGDVRFRVQLGGRGKGTQSMLDWTDEQWEAIRPKKK